MSPKSRHDVVVIGSGFGGLFTTQALGASDDVRVTLVAKTAHHLFQPLLYQVATGILSEGEIAPATREILRHQINARSIQGLVTDIDLQKRVVTSRFHNHVTETPYDSLVVAAGAGQSYFGNDQFKTYAPGMKSIDDALELRGRIFSAFELAETEDDPVERARLLTFVVVGAGPTGVEMAGQIRELSTKTLSSEFRHIDPSEARVILLDGAPAVLPVFGDQLSAAAKASLEDMGVEVLLNAFVTDVDGDGISYKTKSGDVHRIEAKTKVWAAGVQASELTTTLSEQTGAQLDRAGRISVQPDLTLPGHPEVYVIGDMAAVEGVPGVAQGAIQEGKYAAESILAKVRGEAAPGPFQYKDLGSMATISKYSAVASIGKLHFTGFVAWLLWLAVHLQQLVGFKNRVSTLLHWFITFFGNGRSQRVTTNQQLVGRLALEQLGQGASGDLLAGQPVTTGSKPARRVD